jgi:hypothetical protein
MTASLADADRPEQTIEELLSLARGTGPDHRRRWIWGSYSRRLSATGAVAWGCGVARSS